MDDLLELSLSELAPLLIKRELKVSEVVKSYLTQINATKNLNAFITINEEEALQNASHLDAVGPKDGQTLFGIPIAIKDLILTKGIRTTAASKMLENFIAPYDATVTLKLKTAGALVLGKTNHDEFGMGSSNENSYFGPVHNPCKLGYVPGGSSGGSAAAVKARASLISLGTDTGGSCRQPAAFCGVTGFKPTYGRISRYGVIAFASSLDQVGVLARNALDTAMLLEVIAGSCENDQSSAQKEVAPYTKIAKEGDLRGLRIGLPKEYFITGVSEIVRHSIDSAIKAFEDLGATFVEISLPHSSDALAVYYILAPAEASSNLSRYDGVRYGHRTLKENISLREMYEETRSEGFGAEVKRRILLGSFVLSTGYYDAYYRKAQSVRRLIADDFRTVFKDKCDLILTPVAPSPAFPLGEAASDPVAMYLNDIFTIPVSLAGLPAISVPCGVSEDGLPVGMQLIGNYFSEGRVLQAAHHYQLHTAKRLGV
jgi:aspartyl-tRNA(Asn)/glutamyl-tRNA(Gln) amidotransferase subunit A